MLHIFENSEIISPPLSLTNLEGIKCSLPPNLSLPYQFSKLCIKGKGVNKCTKSFFEKLQKICEFASIKFKALWANICFIRNIIYIYIYFISLNSKRLVWKWKALHKDGLRKEWIRNKYKNIKFNILYKSTGYWAITVMFPVSNDVIQWIKYFIF